jgi:hypothetical protein
MNKIVTLRIQRILLLTTKQRIKDNKIMNMKMMREKMLFSSLSISTALSVI